MAARHGSPLVLGVGEDEYFIASDASPIVEYTRNVIYLDEGEIVTINDSGHSIRSMDDDIVVNRDCLLYTSPSPRDLSTSRMPSSA